MTVLKLAPVSEPKAPSTLFEREDEARADIVDLAREADQKAFELDKATKRYEETREPMDRLERDCAVDRREDALTALAALKAQHAPLFAAADQERKRSLLDELSTRLTTRGAFGNARERLIDIVATFRRDLQNHVVALGEAVAAENDLRKRATSLAQGLTGEDFGSVNFDAELRAVVAALIDPDWSGKRFGWVRLDIDPSITTQDVVVFETRIRGGK